ncbi:MAG: hypothetical protein PHN38_02020 [Sulfurospirillaceae bacterium]|nr:hypothetical protein [Sulfurospirillaceae bacterium]
MSSLDSLFDKIDESLANKKGSELSLIFLMIFVFVGFLSYNFIFPATEKILKQSVKNLTEMERKLRDEKSYLASVTRDGDEGYVIKRAKKEIEDAKILLEKTTYTNGYVDNKLKELSYLLFNDENWAKFLDSITYLAKKHNVDIKIIGSKVNEPTLQKIEQILNLQVSFNGSFANVMKFMNQIEESQLVVDIYEFDFKGKKDIEGLINIAVWGMKY